MTFTDAIRTCFSKYADFSGRARRSEYWWFSLFLFLVVLPFEILNADGQSVGLAAIHGLIGLALILPSLAVGARRLHDVGRSGWWLLIGLIPLVGFLVLLFWNVRAGDIGPNAYGPDPKS